MSQLRLATTVKMIGVGATAASNILGRGHCEGAGKQHERLETYMDCGGKRSATPLSRGRKISKLPRSMRV